MPIDLHEIMIRAFAFIMIAIQAYGYHRLVMDIPRVPERIKPLNIQDPPKMGHIPQLQ